jgi:hypothetical protein
MQAEAWEITETGSRVFAASGETVLEVLVALVDVTRKADCLLTSPLVSGAHIDIVFGSEEFEGICTVEV